MEFILQNHSSYPLPGAAPGDTPDRALIADVLQEQEEAGIDIVTDGQIRWRDPVSHIAGALDGVHLGRLLPYFDSGQSFRQPVITAALRRRQPILRDDFAYARRMTRLPVKPVLIGPYTLAHLSLIEYDAYTDVAALAHAFSDILAAEVQDLAQAGARYIQVEEPAILAHPGDIRLLRQLLEPLWAARGDAEMVVASYCGDAEPLYADLNSLPADVLAFDCSSSPKLIELIAAVGASKILALGVVDGRSPTLEDPSAVARDIEMILKRYVLDSVHLLPSCGLRCLPHASARAKLELLGCVRQLLRP